MYADLLLLLLFLLLLFFSSSSSYSSSSSSSSSSHLLVGLVVKSPASRAADLGFDSRLRRGDLSGSSHTSDLIIVTPVATLPGAWRYRVSAGTDWLGVSIL